MVNVLLLCHLFACHLTFLELTCLEILWLFSYFTMSLFSEERLKDLYLIIPGSKWFKIIKINQSCIHKLQINNVFDFHKFMSDLFKIPWLKIFIHLIAKYSTFTLYVSHFAIYLGDHRLTSGWFVLSYSPPPLHYILRYDICVPGLSCTTIICANFTCRKGVKSTKVQKIKTF